MSEFKREERYIVVKIKDLSDYQKTALRCCLHQQIIRTRECVVIESDWPEYEVTWRDIEDRETGVAIENTAVEECLRVFKGVAPDKAYDLLNALTKWHEIGRYESRGPKEQP